MLSRGSQTRSKRLTILDFLRGVAIICVVVDHAFSWLGVAGGIWHQLTIYSVVPLFFLAGITFALSYLRHPPVLTWRNFLPYYWHKVKKLLGAYALGTLVILAFQPSGITWSGYWYNFFTFPAQFYFIAIYMELLLIAPFLLQLWSKIKTTVSRAQQPLLYFIVSLLLGVFSLIGAKILIFPPPIWLPAQQLFGGLELFVFGMGTLAGFAYAQGWKLQPKQKWVLFIASVAALLLIIGTPIH
ncbi:MAG: acyltransferase family protein, partial [bacterium]|nr:acyltransferase family protein [bacterium]